MAGRIGHRSVVLSDGAVIVMGGDLNDGNYKNDVWKSVDSGIAWILVTSNAGWIGKRKE